MRRIFLWLLFCMGAPAFAQTVRGDITPVLETGRASQTSPEQRMHVGLAPSIAISELLTVEARLDLLLWMTQWGGQFALKDNSSRAVLRWRPSTWEPEEGAIASLYPFSSEAVQLGFSQPIRWGRVLYVPTGFGDLPPDAASAVRVDVRRSTWDAFVAVKGHELAYTLDGDERVWMALGGGGISLPSGIRLDLAGVWGPSRAIPSLARDGMPGRHLQRGGTVQIAHASGGPIEPILDVSLYGTDPGFFSAIAVPQQYSEEVSWRVALEGTQLWSDLADPERFGSLRTQRATAAALEAKLLWNRLRIHGIASLRDLAFILREGPGFPKYSAFAPSMILEPERYLRLAADYSIASLGLTPGLVLSATLPASMTDPLGGPRTTVHREWSASSEVPSGDVPEAIWSALLVARWDPHSAVTALAQLGIERNPNRFVYISGPDGSEELLPIAPEMALYGSLVVQARF